ncbi:phenylalanine--tRNA ligase subunit alpha [Candidatus Berkelbacteria bacterium]|nr:phenylalanine--tRNA ligase subunit alpha [Candidatus Berkelbacteria bacterium]
MIQGTLHPITQYLRRVIAIFKTMSFEILDSPEVVSEKHNFNDLLIPAHHPARSLHDTFWLIDGRLPRTQTSAHQIPAMCNRKPPVRFLIPGRVFRNEATDATHETTFHQLEGFVIDTTVSFAHLKGTLTEFIHKLYGADASVRFVPGYFPFVEPGLEVFMQIKGSWLEIGGAGMIHPGVLKNMGVDPEHFQGYAFGMGIERLVMLLHGIDDVRLFYSGNLRFLKQFKR